MRFFVGLHQPADAQHFQAAFISINRVRTRRKRLPCQDWILDSGAFTEISTYGCYRHPPEDYAAEVRRIARLGGNLLAAVSQDYMCEPHILEKTGLTVWDHQRLTIERYDAILAADVAPTYLMPVLQGYAPNDYAEHIAMYGARLGTGAWVGVGSVCKRNADPRAIEGVLLAIKAARSDLRLHGFGIKLSALSSGLVRSLLETADSMAWSFSARKQGRDGNSWKEAMAFVERIANQSVQSCLFLEG